MRKAKKRAPTTIAYQPARRRLRMPPPHKITASAIVAALLVAVVGAPVAAYPRPGLTERVSVASDGAEGNDFSFAAAVSAASSAAGTAPLCLLPDLDDRCESWVAAYTNPDGDPEFGFDIARDVVVSSDGATVVATGGSSGGTAEQMEIAVVAYAAATGTELWRARYGGAPGGWDEPATVEVDGQRVFVTGTLNRGSSGDIATMAYDLATGEELWVTVVDAGGEETAADLAVGPHGVAVAATTDVAGDHDILALLFDPATGAERWRASYDGPHDDHDQSDSDDAAAVAADSSRVYVTGQSRGLGGRSDYDVVTIAYEAADPARLGEELWVDRYDRAGERDGPEDMTLSPDGASLYVGGFAGIGGYSGESAYENYAMLALAFDPATGERLWAGLHGGDGLNWAAGIAADAERVYVAGPLSDPENDRDLDPAAVAFDGSDGGFLWAEPFGLPGHLQEHGMDVAVAPGGVVVTGSSSPLASPSSLVTLGLTSEGQISWIARHNSGQVPVSIDYDPSVAVSADGSAYVTGTFGYGIAGGANQYDIGTLAYRAP